MESHQNKKTENTSEYKMKLVKRHNGAEAGGTGLIPEFESAGISISTPAKNEEPMKGNSDVIVAVLKEMEPRRLASPALLRKIWQLASGCPRLHLIFKAI